MQVYKAWSVAFSKACEGDAAPRAAPVVVLPPITVVLRRRSRTPPKARQPCPLKPPAVPRQAPAGIDATRAWLARAVELCLAAPEAGSESLATVLAGRLDDGLAASLASMHQRGLLPRAIDAALKQKGLTRRPDVPLERIIQSAVRRHHLRPWLEALYR